MATSPSPPPSAHVHQHQKRLVRLEVSAERLGINVHTLRNKIEAGLLRGFNMKGSRLIWVDEHEVDLLFQQLIPTPPELRRPRGAALHSQQAAKVGKKAKKFSPRNCLGCTRLFAPDSPRRLRCDKCRKAESEAAAK